MPTVTSNGVEIPFDPDHFAPLQERTSMLDTPAALRAALREDGYVLLRGVLDPSRLRQLRAAYFSMFDPSYFAPGTTPEQGVFSGRRPTGLPAHGTIGHPAYDFVRGRPFLDFCADEGLARVAEAALGSPVRQLPRRIVRQFDRSRPVASRAHVDYSYLDAGSDRLLTAWIPIGDCALETGGLVYLERSQHLAPAEVDVLRSRMDRDDDDRPLSHDLAWVAESLGRRWLYGDYRAGDVVLHTPHIVHASLDTATDVMRLSADLRFLAVGEAMDERWLDAWAGDDGR